MSKISISELHQKQIEKKNNEIKIFDNILNKCYNRIKLVSERSHESSCFFQSPEFIFGIPMYDSYKCSKYLIKNLISEGFMVIYTHPNLFYISWDINLTKSPQKINNNNNNNNNNFNNLKSNQIKNNYKQICDYKPTGNFLNHTQSISNNNNNNNNNNRVVKEQNNNNLLNIENTDKIDISNLIL